MKKTILFFAFVSIALATYADQNSTTEGVDAQYIITDCGTVHEIPANSTAEEACDLLDKYSEKDCG